MMVPDGSDGSDVSDVSDVSDGLHHHSSCCVFLDMLTE